MNIHSVFHIIRSMTRNEKVQLLEMLTKHLALPDINQFKPGDTVSFSVGNKVHTGVVLYLLGDFLSVQDARDERTRWKVSPGDIIVTSQEAA